ncbi:class I SAM-dependent methyltransferase [Gammaproteobacteria bacterium]|nr:class I SAM-dependent methyltransferase [Gammaproteobacteria bacterium]MDC3279269.1 class I SAM-dependent methyltransferase [Gammaproteobacteria bacterium]
MKKKMFDFGENWKHYSNAVLTQNHISEAEEAFETLTREIDLKSRNFLDVGFGQGLSAFLAAKKGANVTCLDINLKCEEALKSTEKFFDSSVKKNINLNIGSILDSSIIKKFKNDFPRGFDVIHSWGVLHHTGNMNQAFFNCASMLAEDGFLIIAIYNRHWSSPVWRVLKRIYCNTPVIGKKILITFFTPIIFLAKLIVTGKNPLRSARGMDFFVDIVDWVGGYPYEYASVVEIEEIGRKNNLQLENVRPSNVPTGCNEFIFRRRVEKVRIKSVE